MRSSVRFLGGTSTGVGDEHHPVWVTDENRPSVAGFSPYSQQFVATSPISVTPTYSVVGSLPSGLTLNGDTVSGSINNPSSPETRTFTLRAATGTLVKDRTFSLPVTVGTAADPDYAFVKGLWHFNGSWNDTSDHARTILNSGTSVNGGLSSVQSKFGGQSLFFNGSSAGSGCNIRIPASSDMLIPASTDFCFEFQMRASLPQSFGCMMVTANSAFGAYGTGEVAGGINIGNWTGTNGSTSSGTARTSLSVFVGGGQLYTTSNPNDSTWHHIAIVRSAGVMKLYFDGTAQGPSLNFTGTIDFGQNHGLILGRYVNNATNNIYVGYFDEIRMTVGSGRYTSNFTPPTAEFAYP